VISLVQHDAPLFFMISMIAHYREPIGEANNHVESIASEL